MRLAGGAPAAPCSPRVEVHKDDAPPAPRVSIILLDWSVRERFTVLKWLRQQDVPKDQYELIWVELFERVVPEVLESADIVMTCRQHGAYQKHLGYNQGLLKARGEIVVVCDSDAIFPRDFVRSILRSFEMDADARPIPLVLQHFEWRTAQRYPDRLDDAKALMDATWAWWPLVNNAGACMSVRREDAIRFGGFDEHKSFRGYVCGPYELGWRLVNAGIPERWHDPSVALWHFAHPDPVGTNGMLPTIRQMMEHSAPHIDMHAVRAVEAFSAGRILPLKENPEIWHRRMARREIGSALEARYAVMTGPAGFSRRLQRAMAFEQVLGRPLQIAHLYWRWAVSRALAGPGGPLRRLSRKWLPTRVQEGLVRALRRTHLI